MHYFECERFAEYIDLDIGMFDLIIIDEASQVSIAQAFHNYKSENISFR